MTVEIKAENYEYFLSPDQETPEIFREFTEFFDVTEDIPLEAPCMEVQAAMIRDAVLNIPELQFDNWVGLTVDQRLLALTQLEQEMAQICLRQPLVVSCEKLKWCHLGHCDGTNLVVSQSSLMDNSYLGFRRLMETFFHEARHGYQIYNISVQQVESNDALVKAWDTNFYGKKGYINGGWSFRDVGFMRYQEQPVEVDARVFAERVLQELEMK